MGYLTYKRILVSRFFGGSGNAFFGLPAPHRLREIKTMSASTASPPSGSSGDQPIPWLDSRALLDAVAAIAIPVEVKYIAAEAARQLLALIGGDACAISRWDEQDNSVSLWAEVYGDQKTPAKNLFSPFDLREYPFTARVLREGIPGQIQCDDPAADPAERDFLQKAGSQAALMLPLHGRHRTLGLIELYDDQPPPRRFTPEEIALAQVVASHAGLALERGILLQEANQRATEMEALQHASLTLTSGMELTDVFQAVLAASLKISPHAANVHIFTYSGDRLHFGAARWALPAEQQPGPFAEPRPEGLTYKVARTGHMILVDDIRRHPLYAGLNNGWSGSLLGIPLKASDRVVGVMNMAFDHPRTVPQSELQLLNLLADQAAVAIDRAMAFEAARQRAAELEALQRASLRLTASLDPEEAYAAVLETALQLSEDTLDAHIFLYENERLRFGAAHWASGDHGTPWAEPRPDGLTYRVARGQQAIAVEDTGNHPLFTGQDTPDNPDGWQGAIIGLPLKLGERVVGVLNVAYRKPRPFNENDLRVLSLLADQAAISIENARLHELVSQQAITDALTNLPNRRAFDARLAEEIRRAGRYKHRFALVILDMNNFKHVNDTFGHPAGDDTLRRLAATLQATIRDTDFVSRLGGDEFALLLPETRPEEAERVAEKVRRAVQECQFAWSTGPGQPFALSTALGLAHYPTDANHADALIAHADAALYAEKQGHPRP